MEIQRRKVVMVNTSSCEELEEMVEKDMRLKEYGGI
jgi:hypothetical protein